MQTEEWADIFLSLAIGIDIEAAAIYLSACTSISPKFQNIFRIPQGSYLSENQNEGGSDPSEFWTITYIC